MKRRVWFFGLALLLPVMGCTVYPDFVYPTHKIVGAEPTGLKIAVLPFEDQRKTLDHGSKGWSYLPLIPWASHSEDRRQASSDRFTENYYWPDLVPYAIALELIDNKISHRVDIAPAALEDYDLIIHGVLKSTKTRDRRISYGLGPLGFITSLIALPQGSVAREFTASYAIYDARGEQIEQHEYAQPWSSFHWGGGAPPMMHGLVTGIRDANKDFVTQLVAKLKQPPYSDLRKVRDERIRLYHTRLDPELGQLIEERDRVRQKDGQLYQNYAQDLTAEIMRRGRNLEKYRRAEQTIIAKQQQHIYETQHLRLEQIAGVRRARRVAIAKQAAAKQAHSRAVMSSLAGAVAGGLVPTSQALNATGGNLTPALQSQMAQDLSAALAAMPDAPPPPPDMSGEIAKLHVDTRHMASAGGLLQGLQGNNLAEIRGQFLKRYAKTTRSLDQIKGAFMSRHR